MLRRKGSWVTEGSPRGARGFKPRARRTDEVCLTDNLYVNHTSLVRRNLEQGLCPLVDLAGPTPDWKEGQSRIYGKGFCLAPAYTKRDGIA